MRLLPWRTKMVLVYDVTIGGTRFVVQGPAAGQGSAGYGGWQMTVDRRRVKVLRVDRLRDGGTTIIRTGRGTLTIPQTAIPTFPWPTPQPRWEPHT